MFDWVRARVLQFLRVPAEPTPPFGAPGSLRVFRAGRNYQKLLLLRWGLGQVGALIGLAFSLGFFWWFQGEVENARVLAAQPAAATPAPAQPPEPAPPPTAPAATTANSPANKSAPAATPAGDKKNSKASRATRTQMRREFFKSLAARTPPLGLTVLKLIEIGGVIAFLAQIPFSLAAVKLEFELHWYIVTDRSLRIRTGLLSVQESTMSFANLQHVTVTQGPLQRLLGLADVHVQSAGGGSSHDQHGHKRADSLHLVVFHAVENATEIRDLILARLQAFRATGLGDPDEAAAKSGPIADAPPPLPGAELAAAHELLAEARALRAALTR